MTLHRKKFRRPARTLAAAVLLASSTHALAVSFTWDTNSSAAGFGGSGNWSGANWANGSTTGAVNTTTWTNGINTAEFRTLAAATITVDQAVQANQLFFPAQGDWILATDNNAAHVIAPGTVGGNLSINANPSATVVINAVLANNSTASSVVFSSGANTTITLNAVNTYTGSTSIFQGIVAIGSQNQPFGPGVFNIILNSSASANATLAAAANTNVTLTRKISLGDAVANSGGSLAALTAGNTLQVNSAITGTGASNVLNIAGAGTVLLTNTLNTWAGGTRLFGGELSLANDNLAIINNTNLSFFGGILKLNTNTLANIDARIANPATFSGGFNLAAAYTSASPFSLGLDLSSSPNKFSLTGPGQLKLAPAAKLPAGNLAVTDGALDLNGHNQAVAAATLSGTITNSSTTTCMLTASSLASTNGTLKFNLVDTATYDRLRVTGPNGLTLNGLTLQFLDAAAPEGYYQVIQFAGTIQGAGVATIITPGSAADPIELRIYTGASGDFSLYEDEGDTYNYEKGAYAVIPMHWDDATHTLTIGARKGTFPGMLQHRTFHIVFVGENRGTGINPTLQPDKSVDYSGSQIAITR